MTTLDLKNQQEKETERLQAYYHRLKSNTPCQFSKEELIEEVKRAVEDAENGGGKSMEEMRQKITGRK